MVTKLNDKRNGTRRLPDSKRMTFEGGQPKSVGNKLPLKTARASRKGK